PRWPHSRRTFSSTVTFQSRKDSASTVTGALRYLGKNRIHVGRAMLSARPRSSSGSYGVRSGAPTPMKRKIKNKTRPNMPWGERLYSSHTSRRALLRFRVFVLMAASPQSNARVDQTVRQVGQHVAD